MEAKTAVKKYQKRALRSLLRVLFSIVAVAAVVAPVAYLIATRNHTERSVIADITVAGYRVATSDGVTVVEEQELLPETSFSFLDGDVDANKMATSFNNNKETIEINTVCYVKLVYDVKNISDELYYFKLDFDAVRNENCAVSYSVNGGESIAVDPVKKYISAEIDQSIKIEVYIKVDNPAASSVFTGNILFSITAFN